MMRTKSIRMKTTTVETQVTNGNREAESIREGV